MRLIVLPLSQPDKSLKQQVTDEAVNKAVNKTHAETRIETQREEKFKFARLMLLDGEDYLKVMRYTGLTRKEIEQIQLPLEA